MKLYVRYGGKYFLFIVYFGLYTGLNYGLGPTSVWSLLS